MRSSSTCPPRWLRRVAAVTAVAASALTCESSLLFAQPGRGRTEQVSATHTTAVPTIRRFQREAYSAAQRGDYVLAVQMAERAMRVASTTPATMFRAAPDCRPEVVDAALEHYRRGQLAIQNGVQPPPLFAFQGASAGAANSARQPAAGAARVAKSQGVAAMPDRTPSPAPSQQSTEIATTKAPRPQPSAPAATAPATKTPSPAKPAATQVAAATPPKVSEPVAKPQRKTVAVRPTPPKAEAVASRAPAKTLLDDDEPSIRQPEVKVTSREPVAPQPDLVETAASPIPAQAIEQFAPEAPVAKLESPRKERADDSDVTTNANVADVVDSPAETRFFPTTVATSPVTRGLPEIDTTNVTFLPGDEPDEMVAPAEELTADLPEIELDLTSSLPEDIAVPAPKAVTENVSPVTEKPLQAQTTPPPAPPVTAQSSSPQAKQVESANRLAVDQPAVSAATRMSLGNLKSIPALPADALPRTAATSMAITKPVDQSAASPKFTELPDAPEVVAVPSIPEPEVELAEPVLRPAEVMQARLAAIRSVTNVELDWKARSGLAGLTADDIQPKDDAIIADSSADQSVIQRAGHAADPELPGFHQAEQQRELPKSAPKIADKLGSPAMTTPFVMQETDNGAVVEPNAPSPEAMDVAPASEIAEAADEAQPAASPTSANLPEMEEMWADSLQTVSHSTKASSAMSGNISLAHSEDAGGWKQAGTGTARTVVRRKVLSWEAVGDSSAAQVADVDPEQSEPVRPKAEIVDKEMFEPVADLAAPPVVKVLPVAEKKVAVSAPVPVAKKANWTDVAAKAGVPSRSVPWFVAAGLALMAAMGGAVWTWVKAARDESSAA